MEFIVNDSSELLQFMCKSKKKWGIYIGAGNFDDKFDTTNLFEEYLKAVPFLKDKDLQIRFAFNGGFIFAKSQEEIENLYWQVVGDDGPTKLNPYNGPVRVYALTCDPTGQCWNENT